MNLDTLTLETIDSITKDSVIQITAYSETNDYIIKVGYGDSLDLISLKCDDVFWDGGYESLEEVKNHLAADYSLGRITGINVHKIEE
jgi:hypothetical protein